MEQDMNDHSYAAPVDLMMWQCNLCSKRGKNAATKGTKRNVFRYTHQDTFKDHYDRTCHICFAEFTNKMSKDCHQVQHSNGISSNCKSLCSLCGKKFKVNPMDVIVVG